MHALLSLLSMRTYRGFMRFPRIPAGRVSAEIPPLPGGQLQGGVPDGIGRMLTLWEIAAELSRRLTRIFLRDENGRRPVHGENAIYRDDPNWRDLVLFYEYFHGDNGTGLGASHQTGWTPLVAKLLQQSGE
jgi:hypothetical protein